MNRKIISVIVVSLVLAALAGCAPGTAAQIDIPAVSIQVNSPGPNSLANTVDVNGKVAGILLGVWHGIISPVTEVLSFVNPSIQMYEVHNDGSQYNLGFLVGVALIFLILGGLVGSRYR